MKRIPFDFFSLLPCIMLIAAAEVNAQVIDNLFGQQRSDSEDVVFFRNNDVLRGTVLNEAISVNTPYGLFTVPLRKCAGLSFEGARANTEAIVTVNFNRFTGIITDSVIRFKIGTSGNEIQIRKEKVTHVLLKRTAGERNFADPNAKTTLFLMTNGDLLTGSPEPARLTITTDYADVPVSFAEIKQVVMQGGDQPTAVVTKKNNDMMRGKLATEELTVNLVIGNIAEAVYKDKFAKMFVDNGNAMAVSLIGGVTPQNDDSSQDFLIMNARRPGVKVTASGLQFEVLQIGDGGARPTGKSKVTVHYHGTLIDGTPLDSSYDRGEPISFYLNRILAGLTEGLQLMTVGSRYKFFIPSHLAYGERGSDGIIGPNATLIFEVELLAIQ